MFVIEYLKEENCNNGKIKRRSTIQDRSFITLDNGREIIIKAIMFDLYSINTCYGGTK